ncbi:hypothetical protein V6N11_062519 [Hibiscus sabdariffa]|uniref:Uncharacterized protein n=1 Tax=Hibiscus sabdariffa TaxID=183260 RepID=A0ABR2PST2_9ROSI
MASGSSNVALAYEDAYTDLHRPAVIIGGSFALVAVVLSLFLVLQHLRSYTNPAEQKWIVAIVFMVPVYATESMILKTFCALLALLLEVFGVYGDGEFKWYYGYPYITVVMNFSQMWALYCLVQFYDVTHERLRPIRPLAKFISFKAIVFATWWQGVAIALLCAYGVLPKEGKMRTALQDFLICIEMAIAAVAHIFVFSVEPYHFLPVSENRKERVTTETTKAAVKVEQDNEEKPAVLEKTETQVEAPGTSIKESVQDIVVEGGQRVVEDVVLTINQAIGPVEKGVTKIQETFHMKTDSDVEHVDSKLEVEEHVEKHVPANESHSEPHV